MPLITAGNVISDASQIRDGIIKNADIATDAAISLSKVSGAAASGANADITSLSSLSTPLSVAQGGTGAATLTAHGVLVGNGTGAVAVTDAGTSGYALVSNGASADPTFQAIPAVTGIKVGSFTKDIGDASTTQNIAHGCGATPKLIRLSFFSQQGQGNVVGSGVFVYNGTTKAIAGEANTAAGMGNMSQSDVRLFEAASGTAYQTGVVSMDATNISIVWTKTNSPTGYWACVWEAFF
jgi:hypothetical protein